MSLLVDEFCSVFFGGICEEDYNAPFFSFWCHQQMSRIQVSLLQTFRCDAAPWYSALAQQRFFGCVPEAINVDKRNVIVPNKQSPNNIKIVKLLTQFSFIEILFPNDRNSTLLCSHRLGLERGKETYFISSMIYENGDDLIIIASAKYNAIDVGPSTGILILNLHIVSVYPCVLHNYINL